MFTLQLVRTTIFTKHSPEARPDDDLNAENLRDNDARFVEMALLNGEKRTNETSESFVERGRKDISKEQE